MSATITRFKNSRRGLGYSQPDSLKLVEDGDEDLVRSLIRFVPMRHAVDVAQAVEQIDVLRMEQTCQQWGRFTWQKPGCQ